jgi:hypothetical protein
MTTRKEELERNLDAIASLVDAWRCKDGEKFKGMSAKQIYEALCREPREGADQ